MEIILIIAILLVSLIWYISSKLNRLERGYNNLKTQINRLIASNEHRQSETSSIIETMEKVHGSDVWNK